MLVGIRISLDLDTLEVQLDHQHNRCSCGDQGVVDIHKIQAQDILASRSHEHSQCTMPAEAAVDSHKTQAADNHRLRLLVCKWYTWVHPVMVGNHSDPEVDNPASASHPCNPYSSPDLVIEIRSRIHQAADIVVAIANRHTWCSWVRPALARIRIHQDVGSQAASAFRPYNRYTMALGESRRLGTDIQYIKKTIIRVTPFSLDELG
jgi:hypothetical protein